MSQKNLISKPPNIFSTGPNVTVLKKGTLIFRVHQAKHTASTFNPGQGQPGRFSPIIDSNGNNIPTLYAGSSEGSALAESVFRNIVATSPAITRRSLRGQQLSKLQTTRDLKLVDLTGSGLRRLGLMRAELLESDPSSYHQTARWAEALHNHSNTFEGMLWVSRQFDTEQSYLLFGDRIQPGDLAIVDQIPLFNGPGFQMVLEFADDADITIIL